MSSEEIVKLLSGIPQLYAVMEQIDNLPTVDIVKGDEERYMSLKEKYSMLKKGVIRNDK